ncbi:MAG: transposase, partial [Myxococcaceae bacterium]
MSAAPTALAACVQRKPGTLVCRLPVGREVRPPRRSRRCATLEGFSLHANTRVHENDRTGLKTLCRYGARGPLSLERLSLREDGRLAWRMKRPAPDGSTHLLFTPLQLVRKLAALFPPPRFNLTRFHG